MSIIPVTLVSKSFRDTVSRGKYILPAGIACLLFLLPIGCGGSTETPSPGTSPVPTASPSPRVSPSPSPIAVAPFMNFLWGARTRNVGVDASTIPSALSAVVRFYPNGSSAVTPVEVKLNRDQSNLVSYSTKLSAGTGTSQIYLVTVTLYSESDQVGTVVGTASFTSSVNSETGELDNSVAVGSIVRTVTLSAPDSLSVGQTVDVTATATDGDDNIVPVTLGSTRFTVTSGSDKVAIVDTTGTAPFQVRGVSAGTATLTATIDGVTSDATTITVSSPTSAE